MREGAGLEKNTRGGGQRGGDVRGGNFEGLSGKKKGLIPKKLFQGGGKRLGNITQKEFLSQKRST